MNTNLLKKALTAGLGGLLAIFIISLLGFILKNPILIAPFGASCVILFGLPESPLAKPKNLILGHFISSLVGLIMLNLFGNSYIVISIAVGLAIFMMIFTGTTHPPAGADPIFVITASISWKFLFTNILIGTILLFIISFVYHNIICKTHVNN
ncbi:HPP family protein [Clostridium sp. YIM B02555]|uniref:HPP family protein n=1 Tax=Clostridium sp. YIM B02555 TaxID=2911968 RepID=UPI001EEEEDD1|nr:HPP family protein [Clostridium sp. YIM B02555]